MRSQSVLTLCLLFWLSFGVVWKVTKAYAISSEPEDSDEKRAIAITTEGTIPSKPTENLVQTKRSKRSKGEVDSSVILFPNDNGYPKCEDTHTCSTLNNCHPFSKKNSICGWNGTLPLVCCLKNQTKIPLDHRIISESECFRQKISDAKIFVVGGEDVDSITQWPFMVGIFKRNGEIREFSCGGSLISRRHVLTAAHCFLGNEYEHDVISGLLNLKSIKNGEESFTIHPVTKIQVHPNFKYPILHDDIAILTIPNIEVFSPITRPVCLPLSLLGNGDTGKGSVLGWGKTRFDGDLSDQLQKAEVDFVDRSTCEKANKQVIAFFDRRFPKGISSDIVCAGNKDLSKDSCEGDSGGPLVVADERNVWRLVGVVSNGVTCGVVGLPGIYTRVDQYIDWIKTTAAID